MERGFRHRPPPGWELPMAASLLLFVVVVRPTAPGVRVHSEAGVLPRQPNLPTRSISMYPFRGFLAHARLRYFLLRPQCT